MSRLEEISIPGGEVDMHDLLGIEEESVDAETKSVIYGNLSKWVAFHGEETVRSKRSFFLKHLAVLGITLHTGI